MVRLDLRWAPVSHTSARVFAAAALFLCSCGATDKVSEASDDLSQRASAGMQELEAARVCVDAAGTCPKLEEAHTLVAQALDDCYDVVTIDSGPDASCCFGVTVERAVDAALDCL